MIYALLFAARVRNAVDFVLARRIHETYLYTLTLHMHNIRNRCIYVFS